MDNNRSNGYQDPHYCHKCGTQLLPDSMFCDRCGTKVEIPVVSPRTGNAVEEKARKPKKERKPINKKLLIGVISAAIVLLTVGGFFGYKALLPRTNATDNATDNDNEAQTEHSKENKTEDFPTVENHVSAEIGHFNSLADLEEAAQRNPGNFALPVVLSVQGTIVRTTDDKLILVYYDDQNFDVVSYSFFRENKSKPVDLASVPEFEYYCKITMQNDSENRVLTGDNVVITGVYTNSTKTMSDCTSVVLPEGTSFTPANMGQFNSLADLKEATQRNPGNFSLPVVLSVQGLVIRTTNDKIYLIDLLERETMSDSELYFWAKAEENIKKKSSIREDLLKGFNDTYCCLTMLDDTTNRALTGDIVTVTGTYRQSTQTIYNASYQMVGKYN